MRLNLQRLLTQLPRLNSWDVGSSHGNSLWEGCMWVSDRLRGCHALGMAGRIDAMHSVTQPACASSMQFPLATKLKCTQVGDACLHESHGEGRNPATGGVPEMTFCGIRSMPALKQLIAAALPTGVQPSSLLSLSVYHSWLDVSALHGCIQLAHATRLLLSVCSFHGGDAATAIEALLQQAPRLQSLTLLGCFRGQPIPAAVVERTGLKSLSLQSNDLADLPDGPYLQGEPGPCPRYCLPHPTVCGYPQKHSSLLTCTCHWHPQAWKY